MTTGDMAGLYTRAEAECQIQQLEQRGFTFDDTQLGTKDTIATSDRVADPDGGGGNDFDRISRFCAASG